MGNWVLNIVGGVENEAESIVADVVKAAKDAGHVIHSVRLTTDAGERVIQVAKDADEVVDAVDPAAKPLADGIDADVDKLVADVEAKENPTTATPTTTTTAPPA